MSVRLRSAGLRLGLVACAAGWSGGALSAGALSFAALLAGLLSTAASSAAAKEVQTSFQVSATVRAVAVIDSESAPADLQITSLDIARGFVDVTQPMRLVVRSNSPDGFVIDLATMSALAASMTVHGLDADLDLGAGGGSIVQRWQHPQSRQISLTFRLLLAPTLAAGRYPWPMRVAVRPLETPSR